MQFLPTVFSSSLRDPQTLFFNYHNDARSNKHKIYYSCQRPILIH